MARYLDSVLRYTGQLGSWEWCAVMLGVFVIGIFCLRGFGSRTNY